MGWCVADAQALPFPAGAFDAVVANHMLYHVPDRPRALAEIRRVLRPEGVLIATKAGRVNLRELDALTARFAAGAMLDDAAARFGLENGEEPLRPWFAAVARVDFPNALAITEVEPVVAYLMSRPASSLTDARLAALRAEVETTIQRDAAFQVTKTTGLFRCRAAR